MSRLFLCLIAFLTTSSLVLAGLPLRDGEKLTYRVSWAVVPGAGEIKIAAQQDPTQKETPRLLVTTNTATRGFARVLMRFNAEAKSVFDLQTGRLLSLDESSEQKDKKSAHGVTFDYATRQATYLPSAQGEQARVLPIPSGDPTDLMMGLLQTRSWDLKPGEKRDALILFDDDFYELTIHMARYEDLNTPLGKFRTMVLEPRMDKTAPKGMFKRGSSVRIWIAQDRLRLPVKFEVEFKIGTGTATLTSYEGPSTAPLPAATADAKNPRP